MYLIILRMFWGFEGFDGFGGLSSHILNSFMGLGSYIIKY